MKTMTCEQLGGACDLKFQANTFDEMVELSKAHGTEMFKQGEESHLKVMNDMKELMKSPEAIKKWFDDMRKKFDNTPRD